MHKHCTSIIVKIRHDVYIFTMIYYALQLKKISDASELMSRNQVMAELRIVASFVEYGRFTYLTDARYTVCLDERWCKTMGVPDVLQ